MTMTMLTMMKQRIQTALNTTNLKVICISGVLGPIAKYLDDESCKLIISKKETNLHQIKSQDKDLDFIIANNGSKQRWITRQSLDNLKILVQIQMCLIIGLSKQLRKQ